MEASIITTYRCNAQCRMCNIWKNATKIEEEIRPRVLAKLPLLNFCNITGGEPFIRDDLDEIIAILRGKAKRIVISTNGYFTDRILDIAKCFPGIGFRISLEGLPAANDTLRGLKDGFDHGLRSLIRLKEIGIRDIGFGITVSDENIGDLMDIYHLSKDLGVEFATAVIHNSYYFHKYDNNLVERNEAASSFNELIDELLSSKKIKDWFRAYFNYGLVRYIEGKKRILPCEAGTANFFLDPCGEIQPCNGYDIACGIKSMGNINEKSFNDIWDSVDAETIRERVRECSKNCWMIGTAAPVMKKYIMKPLTWVIKSKVKKILGMQIGFK